MCLEVLAPAGNLEKLKIGLTYGADAVYLAGRRFGLRSAADNFSLKELTLARKLTTAQGVKLYLTLNGHLLDWEIEQLPEFLQELRPIRPDAVIVSDLGVAGLIQKHLAVPVHVSTQASVLNHYHAQIWKDQGAKRVVVGRELSLEAAAELKAKSGLEVELFIQGALCMSYSGHCTLSNYLAARDANRGGCIQSCRYSYEIKGEDGKKKNAYFMNSKDLKGLGLLPRFIELGIDAVKIEGRMKSNLYLATTLRAYRRALAEWTANPAARPQFWEEELNKIPHRDYTEGNLTRPAGADSVHHEAGESFSKWALAGTILAAEGQEIWLQAKNRLTAEQELEFLDPQGLNPTLPLKRMTNLMGDSLKLAQPGQVVRLQVSGGPALRPHFVARYLKEAATKKPPQPT